LSATWGRHTQGLKILFADEQQSRIVNRRNRTELRPFGVLRFTTPNKSAGL
jgi:hypothetical protein